MAKSKFCPLTRHNCLREACEFWDPQYQHCAIVVIARVLRRK